MGATASAERVEQERGHLAGDEVGRLGDLGGGAGVGEVLAELAEPDAGGAGQPGDREVDVVRQGEVDVDLGAAGPTGERLADVVGEHDPAGRPGGGDDDVGVGEGVAQVGQGSGRTPHALGDRAGAVVVAVGDDDGAGARRARRSSRRGRPCPRRR